jgi:plasmid stability protein
MPNMEKTTLYLPATLDRELKEAARSEGRSMAALVRDALRAYLAQRSRPEPTFVGSGEDADLHARDSEDWLRTAWSER